MTLPHDPAFSLSVWLREEADEDFVFSADNATGDFLLEPGNSPGFNRSAADISADPESVAVARPPATSISDSLSTPADRAWRSDMAIQPADFILADRYLPVRFSINADPPFFGYLGLTVQLRWRPGGSFRRFGNQPEHPDRYALINAVATLFNVTIRNELAA